MTKYKIYECLEVIVEDYGDWYKFIGDNGEEDCVLDFFIIEC